ncbi:EamA family transporter [Pilibacter termitis]|uniref:EamA family transporter n=1 Tax=Pilibacter termitis TaxID=263852 RepID=UPI00190E97A5|nr:DMT family transporter [Pilibacter termitis]
MKTSKRVAIGTLYALSAGVMWAISGTLGQIFFENYHGNALWITSMRLVIASFILLFVSFKSEPERFFDIWKDKRNYPTLFFYAIGGVLFVQLTYYLCIQHSNVATATVIQFTGPIFIMLYMAIFKRKSPSVLALLYVFLAMFGVFLMITHGKLDTMTITFPALLFGVLSAVGVATYSIAPKKLLQSYSAVNLTGWGMLLAGIVMNIAQPLWRVDFKLEIVSISLALGIAVLGTAIPFLFSMKSVTYVSALVFSVASASEPIFAAILSLILFQSQLDFLTLSSMGVIITSVLLLAREEGKVK